MSKLLRDNWDKIAWVIGIVFVAGGIFFQVRANTTSIDDQDVRLRHLEKKEAVHDEQLEDIKEDTKIIREDIKKLLKEN